MRPHRPAALSRPGPLSKSTGVRWCRCRSRPPDAPLRMRVGGRLADHVADFESNARRERSNEMMSCQSACGAHAQMGRPVRVQLAGAFAHAPLTWRHAILTRLGSGERRCATRGRLRTPSMCLRVAAAAAAPSRATAVHHSCNIRFTPCIDRRCIFELCCVFCGWCILGSRCECVLCSVYYAPHFEWACVLCIVYGAKSRIHSR